MCKQEFLEQLQKGLSGLPREDIEERLSFYSEMIDDRMEEGLSEDEAVGEIGPVNGVVAQILADTPLAKIVKERVKPNRGMKTWEIVLLVLGSPIWLSLLVAVIAVIFSIYVAVWSVIISLWAVFASFAACSVGGVLACVVFVTGGSGASGLAILAAGIVCAGLSILMFYGCRAATDGTLILTRKMAIRIKKRFIRKEEG